MKFCDLYAKSSKVLSLEFFPPKSTEGLQGAHEQIKALSACKPDFMTVTYGAGGGTRHLTQELLSFITEAVNTPAVAHLTCVGHSVAEIDEVLDRLQSQGIDKILALRGDPPATERDANQSFTTHPLGFANACELTAHIAKRGGFSIAVAAYPETHRDAKSPDDDLCYLKSKVEAGAELAITQLFFDCDYYFSFLEKARKIGITVPIVPGVMPISNLAQLTRFTSMCGATIPVKLAEKLESFKDDPNGVQSFGIEFAVKQCQTLLEQGAPGIHLYTLNRSAQALPILSQVFADRAA